jgi:cysteine-rich repeat protein
MAFLLAILLLAGAAHAACGDHVRQGAEQCDGADTGGLACENFCFDGGLLRCNADCTFDTSACTRCGNGRREPGEACDGADLGGWECPEGGRAACYADCFAIDERGCFRCGNGRREGEEACDQADFAGAACDAPGETGGPLTCTPACTIDRSSCWRCGNGRVDPGEECDDGNPDLLDGCTPACATECGDGLVEPNEECDDGNRTDGDGCSALCGLEQVTGGGGGEAADLCLLQWGGTDAPTCRDGASCDRDGTPGTCAIAAGFCLNVAQATSGDPAPCRPTDVARVELAPETTLGPAAREAVLQAIAAAITVGGGSVTRAGDALTVAPPLATRHVCGALVVTVAAGSTDLLAIDAADAGGTLDRDRVTFTCTP